MDFDEYRVICLAMYQLLYLDSPDGLNGADLSQIEAVIRENWRNDVDASDLEDELDREAFDEAVFELSDIWCEGASSDEYVTFLEKTLITFKAVASALRAVTSLPDHHELFKRVKFGLRQAENVKKQMKSKRKVMRRMVMGMLRKKWEEKDQAERRASETGDDAEDWETETVATESIATTDAASELMTVWDPDEFDEPDLETGNTPSMFKVDPETLEIVQVVPDRESKERKRRNYAPLLNAANRGNRRQRRKAQQDEAKAPKSKPTPGQSGNNNTDDKSMSQGQEGTVDLPVEKATRASLGIMNGDIEDSARGTPCQESCQGGGGVEGSMAVAGAEGNSMTTEGKQSVSSLRSGKAAWVGACGEHVPSQPSEGSEVDGGLGSSIPLDQADAEYDAERMESKSRELDEAQACDYNNNSERVHHRAMHNARTWHGKDPSCAGMGHGELPYSPTTEACEIGELFQSGKPQTERTQEQGRKKLEKAKSTAGVNDRAKAEGNYVAQRCHNLSAALNKENGHSGAIMGRNSRPRAVRDKGRESALNELRSSDESSKQRALKASLAIESAVRQQRNYASMGKPTENARKNLPAFTGQGGEFHAPGESEPKMSREEAGRKLAGMQREKTTKPIGPHAGNYRRSRIVDNLFMAQGRSFNEAGAGGKSLEARR